MHIQPIDSENIGDLPPKNSGGNLSISVGQQNWQRYFYHLYLVSSGLWSFGYISVYLQFVKKDLQI